jgi:hypothetical protein
MRRRASTEVFDDDCEHHLSTTDLAGLAMAGSQPTPRRLSFTINSRHRTATSIVYNVLHQGCAGDKADGVRLCAGG